MKYLLLCSFLLFPALAKCMTKNVELNELTPLQSQPYAQIKNLSENYISNKNFSSARGDPSTSVFAKATPDKPLRASGFSNFQINSNASAFDQIKKATDANLLFTCCWSAIWIPICVYGVIVQKPMPAVMALFSFVLSGTVQLSLSLYTKTKINQLIDSTV